LEALWTEAEPALLSKAAEDPRMLEKLRLALMGRSFVDFAKLPEREQASLSRDLQAFAERLCRPLDSASIELERLWRRRLLRLLPIVVLVGAVIALVVVALERADRARNVAHGKPWTVSSRYPVGGCVSPEQACEKDLKYFFHTGEEHDPWLEIDLGAVHSISGLDVRNRTDCCAERALPLVAEVSLDHVNFREVARQPKEFLNWKASFEPVQARWVKLHVPRRSILHLARVRVLR
jgi:hypothetical protein